MPRAPRSLIGATGTRDFVTSYTAGAPGLATLTASSGALETSLGVQVRGLTMIGTSVIDAGGTTMSADTLFGVRITATGYLKKIGLSTKATGMARLGVYTDVNNKPAVLVAKTGVVNLVNGVNQIAITTGSNLDLNGTYWVLGLLASPTELAVNGSTTSFFETGHPFANDLPSTLTTNTDPGSTQYRTFIVVAP